MFYLTAAAWLMCVSPGVKVCARSFGHDFLPFYTAGSFVREGRAQDLYDLHAVKDFEHETADNSGLSLRDASGPWWNPPFYALLFAPLAAMPYNAALATWTAMNVVLCIVTLRLLRHFHTSRNNQDLVPLLLLISTPFLLALTHAQNTFTSLVLLSSVVVFWRQRRGMLAGLTLGLLSYKPQLAAVIGVILVIDLGWRAGIGLAITAMLLGSITAFALPGSLGDYLHRLPQNLHFMQIESVYLWERHITLKAFWRLLLQGRAAGEPLVFTSLLTQLSVAAIGLPLLWIAIRFRGDAARRDRVIAAAIAATPLLMPFYFDYDLLLLAIPAVLIANEPAAIPKHRLALLLAGLNLWLLINPNVAAMTRVNLAVPILSALAASLIFHARRAATAVQPSEQVELPLAAAA